MQNKVCFYLTFTYIDYLELGLFIPLIKENAF